MIHCTKYYYVWFGVLPRPCQRCFIIQNVLSVSFLKFKNYAPMRTLLVAQTVKNLPAMCETWVWSLGQEDPLEKGMATHSSILVWQIPWTGESGRLPSMGSQRVRRDWVTHITTVHQWNVSNPRRSQWRDISPVYVEQEDPAPSFTLFKENLFIWLCWVFFVALRIFSCGVWDLVPWPGIESSPPALGAWSLSHWTAREVTTCVYSQVILWQMPARCWTRPWLASGPFTSAPHPCVWPSDSPTPAIHLIQLNSTIYLELELDPTS